MQKGAGGLLMILGLLLVVVIGYSLYLGTIYVTTYRDAVEYLTQNKQDKGYGYTVLFPSDFSIANKTDYTLTISKEYPVVVQTPYVGVEVFIGATTSEYSLEDWLKAVSTNQPLSVINSNGKLCQQSTKELLKELAKISYGGSDGRLVGPDCLFYGVQNIRRAHVPAMDSVESSQAVEFDVVNGYKPFETHIIVTFGTGGVWDIYKSPADPEDENIDRAYKLMKQSFRFE